ncbi:hypothetical protein [Nocardia sp. NPDC057227]|uniref:hypothetical protein n=1 Tax=Nocardia sp. NPDC057227 TaxID=3346056 RepID=UPI00363A5FEE
MKDISNEQQMNRAVTDLERSAAVNSSSGEYWILNRDRLFEEAMHSVYRVTLEHRDLSAEDWADFRATVSTLVAGGGTAWDNFVDTAAEKILHCASDEWYSWVTACEYRSTVQFLLDEFDAFESLAPHLRELLDDAEESFRTYGPLLVPPGPEVPRGIPAEHWWWFIQA